MPSPKVTEGSQVRVNCRVAGRPAPDVNWHVNGARAVQESAHQTEVPGI